MGDSNRKLYFFGVKEYLPEDLMENAIDLSILGIRNYGWNYQDAIKIIDFLIENKVLVSGGDVYKREENWIMPVHYAWHVEDFADIPTKADLERAKRIGTEYINRYVSRNGDDYLFSVTCHISGISHQPRIISTS